MKEECLVSVLCTAFNHEKYIRQTLQSFVDQQTDFSFEVLVNDDCSTDGTAAIIREFEEKYPAIVHGIYQEKNRFSTGADIYTEVLYPAARGKYFALCEGDDYWTDPTKLARQTAFMEAHPEYSACVHNTMLNYCAGDKADRPLLTRFGDGDVSIANIARGVSYSYHTSSLLGRRDIMENPPEFYFVGRRYGFLDHPNALWLIFNGPIHYIDRCMSVYRIDSGRSAWSFGVDGQYGKLRRYTEGEREVLKASLEYAPEEYREVIDHEVLERDFELMYIEGRDIEQRSGPYREILRAKPLTYRVNNFLKSYLPGLHRLYRSIRGYKE